MAIIPEDIISTHILRHLPSKSVGRFRCVSKEWLSLLTDPKFIQTHQKTLNTNRFIFESSKFCSVPYNNNHEEGEAVQTIIELPLQLHDLNIYGSINGLVLASGYKSLPNQDFTYLVLNLTTKEYVELPVAIKQFSGIKGFGYDSVSGDYKVVIFSWFSLHQNFNIGDVYLYNLRTNTMQLVISHSPYEEYLFNMSHGVFVNGFLHWIFNNRSRQELVIVAFSLADEKLTELPPPSQVDMSHLYIRLVSLGDKLGIFHDVKGHIWVMNDYGVHKSWTKILVNGFNEKFSLYKPIVFYDNGKLLFLTDNRLWIYDVEERTLSKSVHISYKRIEYFRGAYAESLVSPKLSTSEYKSSNSMEEM